MSGDSTEAAIRELSRIVGGLQSSVSAMTLTWQQQENAASQGRRELHQKVDLLRDDMHGLAGQVSGAVKDIADIKPSVKSFEDAKQQAKGAQRLGKLIWGLLTLSGVGSGFMLANWISITPKAPMH